MPLHHVKELLGHTNISQTDTYLNAGRVALQESMKRFDDLRGKPVAKETTIEQRPLGQQETSYLRRSVYTRTYFTYAPVAQLDRAPAF